MERLGGRAGAGGGSPTLSAWLALGVGAMSHPLSGLRGGACGCGDCWEPGFTPQMFPSSEKWVVDLFCRRRGMCGCRSVWFGGCECGIRCDVG